MYNRNLNGIYQKIQFTQRSKRKKKERHISQCPKSVQGKRTKGKSVFRFDTFSPQNQNWLSHLIVSSQTIKYVRHFVRHNNGNNQIKAKQTK